MAQCKLWSFESKVVVYEAPTLQNKCCIRIRHKDTLGIRGHFRDTYGTHHMETDWGPMKHGYGYEYWYWYDIGTSIR
ncbi:hypothetical protein CsSME_00040467 [Camellia sinensis var. sinensis]